MLKSSTIQLLRFHFSLFLLPVYLFALSQVKIIHWPLAFFVFFILHFLVYPSSNGYNSYMDRDETPIGGLASPLQPTKELFYVSVVMDIAGVLFSFFISPVFAMGVVLYILASRAYSARRIRLKRHPFISFLTVFIFQGALIFFITFHAVSTPQTMKVPLLPCFIASLLIGALYPLTQIYQHEEDKKDGVISISYLLGKKGTFVFTAILFTTAAFLMYLFFKEKVRQDLFYLFLATMLPVVSFFLYWMVQVWRNPVKANFKNSMLMNIVSTFCTLAFFIILIILNH